MADIIQIRRDTAANWTAANPILAQGEFGVETDTLKLKIGDGASPWTGLRYYHSGSPYDAGEGISINDFTINNTGIITIGTGGANGTIKANGQDVSVKGLKSGAFVETTDYPDKNLSNLTGVGNNISNWSSNTSNCVIEIPQDVSLGLNNGVYVKSGSKIYYPDGTYKILVGDSSVASGGWGNQNEKQFLFCGSAGALWGAFPARYCQSGASFDVSKIRYDGFGFWYDTVNNTIKWTADGGTTFQTGFSLPLGIVEETTNSGTIDKIDQVFNGCSFIGSSVFVLPGVKVAAPDGRNTDGTLKSAIYSVSNIRKINNLTASIGYTLGVTSSGLTSFFYTKEYDQEEYPGTNYRCWYKPSENKLYNSQNAQGAEISSLCAPLVFFNATTYMLGAKTPLKIVDYNDYANTVDQVTTNTANIALKQNEATALNYDDISNCVTHIPGDIKLEINSSGSLILKSGSKVYIPDGPGVFTPVTMTADHELMVTGTDNAIKMLAVDASGGFGWRHNLDECFSGTTAPTGHTNMLWYDTTNNVIKMTNNGGTTWLTTKYSLPVCIAQRTSTTCIIKQTFNGFGYIGATVFALPGVECLYPNGRNADGTLKSDNIGITGVKTYNVSSTGVKAIRISSSGLFGYQGYSISDVQPSVNFNMWYNPVENIMYDTGFGVASQLNASIAAFLEYDGTRVVSFAPKTVFHAIDYNDTNYIANCAMPSKKYIDLTLGETGSSYTAPSDGYFTLNKGGVDGEWILIVNNTTGLNISNLYPASLNARLLFPASKGDVVQIFYTASGATNMFRFVYVNGSK